MMDNFFKVNLPDSEKSYLSGNGEGVWVICDDETRKAYNQDEEGTTYKVTLDNDSTYYPKLRWGTEIPIEMRGVNRPIVPYQWLIDNYGESEAM